MHKRCIGQWDNFVFPEWNNVYQNSDTTFKETFDEYVTLLAWQL